jgi:aspartate aminotransferase
VPQFSARLGRARVAPAVSQTIRAREMRAAGRDVIFLTIGEPDFPTPAHAVAAAHQAALRGDTKYPPQDGVPALRDAVARTFSADHGVPYRRENVIIANGGKQVIFDAWLATVDTGSEVLIPSPCWSAYVLMAEVCDGTPVTIACPENNGFRPRPEDIEAAITPATRWLVLNFPNNPSGAVLSRDEWLAIADVLRRHPHVWVMVDDIYARLVYNGQDHTTLAAVAPDLADRTLTVGGVSKTYAMTGWRIGFGVGPAPLIRAMANMQGQATAGVSTVGQAAALAALEGPQDAVADMLATYRSRRDLAVGMLNAAPGMRCHTPQGAFYVFPSVRGCLGRVSAGGTRLVDDEAFAAALLEEQGVAAVFGGAFMYPGHLRISYATDTESLREGCRRVQEFCAGLR